MRIYIIAIALALAVVATRSQELVTLSPPIPSVTSYTITEVQLTWGDGTPTTCRIIIRLKPNVGGTEMRHDYMNDQACTLIRALNKANLSTISLQRRIFNQLISDGVLSGSVTGTPE